MTIRTSTTAAFFFLLQIACFSTSLSQFAGVPASWSYEGSTGPANWANLGFDGCNATTSLSQSPINIVTGNTVSGGQGTLRTLLQISSSAKFEAKAVSNNVEFECVHEGSCGTLTIGSKVYPLIQFHFHSRSEHEIDGNPKSFEVHLVHKILSTKEFAVVGVLLNSVEDEGENGIVDLGDPISAIENVAEGEKAEEFTFNLNHVVNENSGYYTYDGGLTTPGCIDPNNLGVKWVVQNTVSKISTEQVSDFVDLIGPKPRGNWRPTQALNGRQVTSVSP